MAIFNSVPISGIVINSVPLRHYERLEINSDIGFFFLIFKRF